MPRSSNGAREVETVKKIVKTLQDGNTSEFEKKFGCVIQDVRERQGNRNKHFDFEIKVNGEWKKVEYKGSELERPNDPNKPWDVGVQFANLGCEKFELVKIYAKRWYTLHIGSGTLKEKLSLVAAIPSFEEWWKDCKSQGQPKTPFGTELKEKLRRGAIKLDSERRLVNESFKVCQNCLNKFASEIIEIANKMLEQKDYWLVNTEWFPKFNLPRFIKIKMNTTKFTDVVFSLEFEGFVLEPRLRWGGRIGCNNLRLDLK